MRRRKANRREVTGDPRYESALVGRFVSTVMQRGKKSVATSIVYRTIDEINKGRAEGDPLEILTRAINNVSPRVEVKSRRIGGATYQVPMEVAPDRQVALALRWLVSGARKRAGAMYKALVSEIRDAIAGQGNAVKKRDDVHRMAQANKAFAHLRW